MEKGDNIAAKPTNQKIGQISLLFNFRIASVTPGLETLCLTYGLCLRGSKIVLLGRVVDVVLNKGLHHISVLAAVVFIEQLFPSLE